MNSKYRRLKVSCDYPSLVDGTLLRSARRNITDKSVHQYIVRKNVNVVSFIGENVSANIKATRSQAFLIGIRGYLPGTSSIHTNHGVSAILTNGRLYCFNPHGYQSQSMLWLVPFLRIRGFAVTDALQYSGPNLQALDTRGVCTQFSYKFLALHPNTGMNQTTFNEYVYNRLNVHTLPELTERMNPISSVRNVGQSSRTRTLTISPTRTRKGDPYLKFKSFMNDNRKVHEKNMSLNAFKEKHGANYNKFVKIRNAVRKAIANKLNKANNISGILRISRNNLSSLGLSGPEINIGLKHLNSNI